MRGASLLLIAGRPWPALFPYTTLFRSEGRALQAQRRLVGLLGSEQPAQVVLLARAGRSSGGRFKTGREEHLAQIQRSEEHTSELQSPCNLVCRLLLDKKEVGSQYVSVS